VRIVKLIAGFGSIATGVGVPVLALLWVYASDYRRMRYEGLLHDPSRLLGVGWKVQIAFGVALALVIGGAVVVYGALRTPATRVDD